MKKKLEEVKAKKEASNPDDYLPDGIDRRILEAQVRRNSGEVVRGGSFVEWE